MLRIGPNPPDPVLGTKQVYVLDVYKLAIAAAMLKVRSPQVSRQDPCE